MPRPDHVEGTPKSKIRKDTRRHPRENVTWPVVVDNGRRYISAETINLSPYGAKLRLGERLDLGAEIKLNIRPHGRPPYEVRAIVWRIDPDGPALLFLGIHHQLIAVAGKPSVATPPAGSPRDARAGTETIILVDDDAGTRALALDALEGNGYTVLDAGADPLRAVRIAKDHDGPIHLLITDVVMPLMNGLHLVERILPLRPSIKVVLMSAYSVSGVSARGDRYLPKPFTVEDLCRTVREALDGRSPFSRPAPPAP
ncbi:MAG TPA: response regulator [Methylomirabilota bacterium]|nr:response regulator [Methylomirabilota bacterium]